MPARPGRVAATGHPGPFEMERRRWSAPATAVGCCSPEGADPLGDPLPRPRRAPDVPEDGDRARHRRPGHGGDPGGPAGIVDVFQMNDRCAAGCGHTWASHRRRDEPGSARAGPDGDEIDQSIRINSTCTVFAGAELRDRLSLGDKREDIGAACTARSSCARCRSSRARAACDEFTFTGGVAKNEAAVKALKELVARTTAT